MKITICPFSPLWTKPLADLYQKSVRVTGPTAYNAEQVAVWSTYPESLREFRDRLSKGRTLMAFDENQRLCGFAQLDPGDHVAFLYTDPDCERQGVATTLFSHLESLAKQSGQHVLQTEASRLAKPFFARAGFEVIEVENAERLGVTFERFRMRKAW